MTRIEALLKIAIEKGASDLHLCSGRRPLMRIAGELVTMEAEPELQPATLNQSLRLIAPELRWNEFEQKGDTDFAYDIRERGRFRCNYYMDHEGPAAAFRVIPEKIPTVEELLLPRSVIDLCDMKKGLVLVTGPTGSGKSTTLAALINRINKTRRDHIITIEDPVEFLYPKENCLINQREVLHHTESFKTALRAALREDPNIVLVGELRDLETIHIALETAETGHLVFGTLHTNTASSAVHRIVEQFPPNAQNQIRELLGASLKAVVAQTLCRKKGGGRIAAYEVLLVNPAIAMNIREMKTLLIANAMEVGHAQGMCVLNQSLIEYIEKGLIEPMEAYLNAVDRKDLVSRMEEKSIRLDFSKIAAG